MSEFKEALVEAYKLAQEMRDTRGIDRLQYMHLACQAWTLSKMISAVNFMEQMNNKHK